MIVNLKLQFIRPYNIDYKVLGELSKYSNEKFNPNEEGKYCAYYINADLFPKDSKLYFKVTLTHGTFEHGNMFYEGSDTKFDNDSTIILSINVNNDSYSNTSDTYYFIISKPNNSYLYFAPPPVDSYNNFSTITVYNIYGSTNKVLEELSKYGHKSFYPSKKKNQCAYYIRTSNFISESELYFNVTLNYGSFEYGKLFYKGYDNVLGNNKEITFYDYVSSNSSINESNMFVVPKTSYKYLYIAPPSLYNYDSQSQVTIYNTYRPYNIEYKVLGELSKYSNEKFNPYKEGKYCAYYLKIDNYKNDKELYFNVILTNGSFEDEHMFYEGSNTEFNNESTIILTNNVARENYFYERNSIYFIISKLNYKYLFFAPPPPSEFNNQTRFTIHNTKTSNSPESLGTSSSSNKVAIGVGVGGAILAVIVAILSIILHKHKKGVQSTSIDTSII